MTLLVTTRDFDAGARLLDLVAEHGATDVSTELRVEDLPGLRATARRQAAEAARDKASAVADALGVSLGRVRAIQEDAGVGLDNSYVNAYAPAEPVAELHGESQAVTVSVAVTYEL